MRSLEVIVVCSKQPPAGREVPAFSFPRDSFRRRLGARERPSLVQGKQAARIYIDLPEVITSHANTDFDAFAAMLAARRLYPGAVVALSGSLNKNVRDFYRLHAEELDVAEPNRLDLDAITPAGRAAQG
jgi:hypothetical protein